MPVSIPQRRQTPPSTAVRFPAVALAVIAVVIAMAAVLKAEVYAQQSIPPDALEFAALTDAE